MSAHHTPGPWSLGGPEGDGKGAEGFIYCDNSTGSAVAIVFGKYLAHSLMSRQEEIANARLVAAAPDLLEALISVVRVADRATKEFDAARAAIAKATGGAK